jgi:hypothetical protein
MDAYGSAVLQTLYNSMDEHAKDRTSLVLAAAVIAAWIATLGAAYTEAEAYSGY